MNISNNLEIAAFYFPNHPALSEAGREITYSKFNDLANRIATGLIAMGVRPGDPIGLLAPNSTDWLIFYFGVLKAGAVAVTFSSLLTPDEMALLINHSKPRFLFTSEEKLYHLSKLKRKRGSGKSDLPGR